MTPRKKIILVLILFLTLAGAFLSYRLILRPEDSSEPSSSEIQRASEELQKKGIQGLKRRQYAPLIVTYQRMLQKYPDNVELKKKLAEAYRAAGDEEKAEQILKK